MTQSNLSRQIEEEKGMSKARSRRIICTHGEGGKPEPHCEVCYAEGNREVVPCRRCGQETIITYHGPRANHTTEPKAQPERDESVAALTTSRERLTRVQEWAEAEISKLENPRNVLVKTGHHLVVRAVYLQLLKRLTDPVATDPEE